MKKSTCLLLILTSLSGYSQAQSATHSRTYNALPDNEQLCMKVVGRMLAKQHVIFSDTKADPEIRRAAERAIDATREAFGHHESYCEAQHVIRAYAPDPDEGFRHKHGEINKFIHSNS